jgi:hypothetical protein
MSASLGFRSMDVVEGKEAAVLLRRLHLNELFLSPTSK